MRKFDVLHSALLLEHLEDECKAMEAPGLIPPQLQRIFEQLKDHQDAQVKLLAAATTF